MPKNDTVYYFSFVLQVCSQLIVLLTAFCRRTICICNYPSLIDWKI